MNYTDGKNNDRKSKEALAALLNDQSNNPFKTLNREEFKSRLQRMDLDEKGRLCNKVNVRPIANGHVHVMDERLLAAFDEFTQTQPIFLEEKTKPSSGKVDYLNPPQSLRKLL